MTDIRIVKSREIAYDANGARVFTDETHIKLLTSFKRGALRTLKGAPLAVFLCVALHEAEDNPGVGHKVIEAETGYSHPAVGDAIHFLLNEDHRFIDECGKERDGTKRYRPAAYAWFGSNREGHPPDKPPGQLSLLPDLERASPIRQPSTESERASPIRQPSTESERASPIRQANNGSQTASSIRQSHIKKPYSEKNFYPPPGMMMF